MVLATAGGGSNERGTLDAAAADTLSVSCGGVREGEKG